MRSCEGTGCAILSRMTSYKHIPHGFDPVFDERSRILVLGSFPSVLLRANAFYYGNPRNRFWRVIAAAWDDTVPPNEGETNSSGAPATLEQSIGAKRSLLLAHGIALWDVIEECDIKRSSDASIKNVVPAHIERITERTRIEAVICNGATAGRLYKRYLQWKVGLAAHVLPSTSPANAAWSDERLIERWSAEIASIRKELATADAMRKESEAKAAAGCSDAEGGASSAGAPEDNASADSRAAKSKACQRGGIVSYAVAKTTAPPASTYAVHKSMQGNKRADTKPELLVRERLRKTGLGGYRLQWKVAGRPDIAWPGKKVCIFVNGCFWHRCPHCNPSVPKKNVEYWTAKFERNVERDRESIAALEAAGWRVHVVWECELKKKTREATFARLLPKLACELGKELLGDATAKNAPCAENSPVKKCAVDTRAAQATPTASTVASGATARAASPDEISKPYYLYVLECGDGTLYTGYTPDVEARLAQHRTGTGAKYTRGRGPLKLLACAEFATKHDAMSAEYRFKHLSRNQKDTLLAHAGARDEKEFAALLREELFG